VLDGSAGDERPGADFVVGDVLQQHPVSRSAAELRTAIPHGGLRRTGVPADSCAACGRSGRAHCSSASRPDWSVLRRPRVRPAGRPPGHPDRGQPDRGQPVRGIDDLGSNSPPCIQPVPARGRDHRDVPAAAGPAARAAACNSRSAARSADRTWPCRATVLQTKRKVASDHLLRPVELESHDHTFGTRPFDAAEA